MPDSITSACMAQFRHFRRVYGPEHRHAVLWYDLASAAASLNIFGREILAKWEGQ
jgi:hypothetical protein